MTARPRVVLVSFGTVNKSSKMPSNTKNAFLNLFTAFPDITFIWNYESDDLPLDQHENSVIRKWLLQNDILGYLLQSQQCWLKMSFYHLDIGICSSYLKVLGHKNLVAFITHRGMNSVVEAISVGKPMVIIPLFSDQFLNANLTKRAGASLTVAKRTASEQNDLP